MELIIENIKTASDEKLIVDLANRLGLRVRQYSKDKALTNAMKKAEKGKMLSKKDALKYLGDD